MTKKDAQMSLPFDIEPSKVKPYAQQHWNITFSKQKKISVLAKRIMTTTIANIQKQRINEGGKMKPYYKFHVSEVSQNYTSKKKLYQDVKLAFDELTDLKWLVEDEGNKKFKYLHLLNTSIKNCGYDNGFVYMALNPQLESFFIELSHYTTYELKFFMHFKSWYSMRLFEILSAFKDTGQWYVEIDEYRKLMDCEKKYKNNNSLLLQRTLTPCQVELNGTKMEFDFKKVFQNGQRGKPKLIALEFRLKNVTIKEIPKSWYQQKQHEKLLNILENNWKISKRNIINYAQVLKPSRIEKLVKTWESKELSNNRINDRNLYCNSAFVKEAKKYIN